MDAHLQHTLIQLGAVWQGLNAEHLDELKGIGARIPVGGAHMDKFFQAEGIWAALRTLRLGGTLEEAIEAGKAASTEAVKKWNGRREYQVHRWENTAHAYIESTVRNCDNQSTLIEEANHAGEDQRSGGTSPEDSGRQPADGRGSDPGNH